MNELQLFRQHKLDTTEIANLTGQTEPEVCRKMHAQRKRERLPPPSAEVLQQKQAYHAEYYRRILKEKRQRIPYAGRDPRGHEEWERL